MYLLLNFSTFFRILRICWPCPLLKTNAMKKQRFLCKKSPEFIIAFYVLIAICFSMANCDKNEDNAVTKPVLADEIKQPLNPNDPAVLPGIKTVIQKLEGDFTPLLSGVLANWRVKSHKQFANNGCWSDWVETYYNGVTRQGVNGKNVYYPGCGVYSGGTWTPDFSAPCSSVWCQYKKGQEVQDGDVHATPGGTVNFFRYYTVPDLPDAYIRMERRWETVPIPGEGDYAYCEGCSSLTKETSTTTGLKVDKTEEWGYTLGVEFNVGVTVPFGTVGGKVTASFNKQFSLNIQNYEEKTTSITVTGITPTGKNIIRLQVFREISTFKLVNKDGGDYYPGIYSPEIAITTQTKNYIWYY